MATWIGIDPGLSGGLCVLRNGRAEVLPMPVMAHPRGKGNTYDLPGIRRIIMEYGTDVRVAIEAQQAMVREGRTQGVTSSFQTGYGFGALVGLCVGLGLSYCIVHPRTWQAKMLAGMPRGDTKAASVIVAQRMFPGVSLFASPRCRTAHNGMSDALLIAVYAERTL